MSLKNCTRKGCKDVFRAFLVESAAYDGEWEIPRMKPEDAEPERLISFSKSIRHKDSCAWVHFFEDDASIERLWNRPRLYLPILKRYAGVISPDFSLYRDMPLVMQANNVYRGRALGHWLQENGVSVIPNIRFGDERTYGFCCAGIEPGGTIAVGSHGCIKGREDRWYFKQGLSTMMETLRPQRLIVYGSAPDDIFSAYRESGIPILQFDSEFTVCHRKAVNA